MYGEYYYLILAIQGFALFHAYRSGQIQKWYFLIIFLPVIGALIYLYDAFYSKKNVEDIGLGVKKIFNPNFNVEQLERELKLADTNQNKINLANAYLENEKYIESLELLDQAMTGNYAEDPYLKMKKLKANYLLGNYEEAVNLGSSLTSFKEFEQSEEKIAFADSYFKIGQENNAASIYESMNHLHCNYKHRLEYLKFLLQSGDTLKSKTLGNTLLHEAELMSGFEKKNNAAIIRELKEVAKKINTI